MPIQSYLRQTLTCCFATCLLAASPSEAEAVIAIEGEVTVLPGSVINAPGQLARIQLTIRNVGDEIVTSFGIATDYYNFGPDSTIFISTLPETSPCIITYWSEPLPPPDPSLISANISFSSSSLAPGTSASCIVGLTIAPEAPPAFTQQFGFYAGPLGSGGSDQVSLQFQLGGPQQILRPQTIPAANLNMRIVLSLVLLIMGGIALMRRQF